MIEINATDFYRLVPPANQEKIKNLPMDEIYEELYWKRGATELASGLKTLTLKQFESKYSTAFIQQAEGVRDTNLWQQFDRHYQNNTSIKTALRAFDHKANVLWPLAHLRSTVRYLQKDPNVIKATVVPTGRSIYPLKTKRLLSILPCGQRQKWTNGEPISTYECTK